MKWLTITAILLSGCTGTVLESERIARERLDEFERAYLSLAADAEKPDTASDVREYVAFSLRTNPAVREAYFEYRSAVEGITVARSLPDPKLALQLQIKNTVDMLQPGLKQFFPGPGKLQLAGDAAATAAAGRHAVLRSAMLRVVYELRITWLDREYVREKIRLIAAMRDVVSDIESIAGHRVRVGAVTQQDVLRARIERERLETLAENLTDELNAVDARWLALTGLERSGGAVAYPTVWEDEPATLGEERSLREALKSNPELAVLGRAVAEAEKLVGLAQRSAVPDFELMLEADVKSAPTAWMPRVETNLPVWRDKIAAQIATAQNDLKSSRARVRSKELEIAVELAEVLYRSREARRNFELYEKSVLPKARESLAIATGGYRSGRSGFLDLLDAEKALLQFKIAGLDAGLALQKNLARLKYVTIGMAHLPGFETETEASNDE